jgi:hypothetical protein
MPGLSKEPPSLLWSLPLLSPTHQKPGLILAPCVRNHKILAFVTNYFMCASCSMLTSHMHPHSSRSLKLLFLSIKFNFFTSQFTVSYTRQTSLDSPPPNQNPQTPERTKHEPSPLLISPCSVASPLPHSLAQDSQLPPSQVFPSFGNRLSDCLDFSLLGGGGEESRVWGCKCDA